MIVPYAGHYSATKFAVEAMFEQLAYELVPHNIGVTVIERAVTTKVWVNRNRYSQELKARAEQEHLDGYPHIVARMGEEDGPVAAPIRWTFRAMAKVLAMPPGTRPLRMPVSGGSIPQTEINAVTARLRSTGSATAADADQGGAQGLMLWRFVRGGKARATHYFRSF